MSKINFELPVRWKPKAKGTANGMDLIPYIDSRDIQKALDEALTPFGWCDKYEEVNGAVVCSIGIKTSEGEWVYKSDAGGSETAEEYGRRKSTLGDSQKGTFTDAFKRAAVKWGFRVAYESGGVLKVPAVEYRGKYYVKDPVSGKPVGNKDLVDKICNDLNKKKNEING